MPRKEATDGAAFFVRQGERCLLISHSLMNTSDREAVKISQERQERRPPTTVDVSRILVYDVAIEQARGELSQWGAKSDPRSYGSYCRPERAVVLSRYCASNTANQAPRFSNKGDSGILDEPVCPGSVCDITNMSRASILSG